MLDKDNTAEFMAIFGHNYLCHHLAGTGLDTPITVPLSGTTVVW